MGRWPGGMTGMVVSMNCRKVRVGEWAYGKFPATP